MNPLNSGMAEIYRGPCGRRHNNHDRVPPQPHHHQEDWRGEHHPQVCVQKHSEAREPHCLEKILWEATGEGSGQNATGVWQTLVCIRLFWLPALVNMNLSDPLRPSGYPVIIYGEITLPSGKTETIGRGWDHEPSLLYRMPYFCQNVRMWYRY